MKPAKQTAGVTEEEEARLDAESGKKEPLHQIPDPAVMPMSIDSHTSQENAPKTDTNEPKPSGRRYEPRSIAIATIIAIVIILLIVWMP